MDAVTFTQRVAVVGRLMVGLLRSDSMAKGNNRRTDGNGKRSRGGRGASVSRSRLHDSAINAVDAAGGHMSPQNK